MLEQLGLGIVLSFQDNFTPQANNAITSMFKLETQAEQMASNVQKSLNNLQNLMLSGFSLSQIGGEFEKAGKAITNFFGNAFKEIAKASSQMETYKAQFKTVFGDKAQEKMNWAVNFAVKTPFELNQLVSSMQKMGSQKIDVSKTFKNSKGQEKAFMEYMGDLATRNMDATGGIQGMGIAISNAWSGQMRSLEQRFDLAKQDLAGLKSYAGKDQAKFMEEFVKLADKYAPNAMKNLEGTWEQTMSNMDDAWFNMMFRLGDKEGGHDVFGSMKKSLNKVAELLFEVSSNGQMLDTLRGIFDDLWKPVDKLADVLVKAVKGIFAFAQAHPELTKLFTKITAITGVALIAVGAFMKLTGGVMIFTTSLVSAYANLKILHSLNLGGELASIAKGFGLLGSLMSTSIITVGALGLAYKFNIGGAREDIDNLIKTFKEANTYKEQLLNTNAEDMDGLFAKKNESLSKQIGFTMAKFEAMKVIAQDAYNEIFKGHSDVLRLFTENHYEPVGAFGLEHFQKTILGLFDAFKGFITSFKEGLGVAYNVTKEFIGLIMKPFVALKNVIVGAFGETTTEGMNNFKEILKDIGGIAGSVIGTLVGFKVVKGLTNILVSPFKALLGVLGKVGRKATETFSKLNPMNWYNKTSKKQYESILNTRGQVSRMTGRGYSEAEYKDMGLGLTRSQRRAGYISQKRAIEQATGRHFSTKQLSAMGLEKPVNIFTATAKSFKDSAMLIGGAIKSKSNLVDTRLSRDPNSGYKLANLNSANQLDRELRDVFFSGRKGYNMGDSVEVKARPKWMDTLFGQRFSSVNDMGQRTNLGSYGGAFTKRRDDNQMRLASQIVKPRGLDRSEFATEKEYRNYMKSKVAPDATTGMKLKDMHMKEMYDKVSKRLGDYIGTGKEGAGQFRKNYTMTPAQIADIDMRRRQAVLGVLNNDQEVLSQYGGRNQRKIETMSSRAHTPTIQGVDANAEVFAKKQGFLSKALFGQKYYTIGQREDGRLYEQQVARTGGLFNRASNDGRINVNQSQGLGSAIQQDAITMKNKVMQGLNNMGSNIRGLGSNIFNKFTDTGMYKGLTNSFSTFKSGLKTVFSPSTYKLSNLKGTLSNIKTQVPQLANNLSNSMKGMYNTVKNSKIPSNTFDRIKLGAGNMKDNLVTVAKGIGNDLGKAGTFIGNSIKGTSIYQKISSTGVYKKLSGALSGLGSAVGNTFSTLTNNVMNASSSIKGKFVSSKMFTGLTGAFSSLSNTAKGFITSIQTNVSGVTASLRNRVGGAFIGLKTRMGRMGSSLGKQVNKILPSSFTPTSMLAGLRLGAGNVKNYMGNVATSFKQDTSVGRGMSAMGGMIASSKVGQYFSGKYQGFKQGASNLVQNSTAGMSSRLPSFMPTLAMSQGGLARAGKGLARGASAVGRGVGAVGRGAIGGAKMIGRGAVGLGKGAMNLGMGAMGLMGGAMRMIPQVALISMLGSAVVGGVKNKGANLNDKDRDRLASKRGLKKDDNLGLGMAKISDDLSKFDFKKFWAGFKKSSKQMIPIFKDIFKDIIRIGKESFPIIFREAKNMAKNIMKEIPGMMKQIPTVLGNMFEKVKPIAGEVWTDFKAKMGQFIAEGLPKLSDGFKRVCSWVAENGIPLIVEGFGKLLNFVGTTVVPELISGIGKFVDWVMTTGIPSLLEGFGTLAMSIIEHLPEILTAVIGLLGNILIEVGKLGLDIIGKIPGWVANLGSLILSGIQTALSGLGSLLSGLFQRALSGALSLLPDVIETPVRNMLGVHHGGLYLSPDEHPAIVQEGETILPRGKAEKLDAMLEGRAYWQNNERAKLRPQTLMMQKPKDDGKEKSKPIVQDMSSHISIENVEVKLVADKLSRSDARKQALMLMEEFRKIQKENDLKNSTKNRRPLMV